MQTRTGQVSSRAAAMRYVRDADNSDANMVAMVEEIGPKLDLSAIDSDQQAMDRADDAFINFLTTEWPGPHCSDLLDVERIALYNSHTPPTKEELGKLWYTREFIERIKDVVTGMEQDIAELEQKKNIRRKKNNTGRAEERLYGFIEDWGGFELMEALRLTEKRATYYHADPLTEENKASLLMFRELIDRVSAFVLHLEFSGRRTPKNVAKRERERHPTTSAN